MPEILEVELYRRLAEGAVGRTVEHVATPDAWFLKGATTPHRLRSVLAGRRVVGAGRHGKLLLLEIDGGRRLGVRFGMTGRLLLGDAAGVDELVYGSARDEPSWDRFLLQFADGTVLRVRDPRRLGGVELEPDLSRLGPDALGVSRLELRRALEGAAAPLKACLLDQHRLAGVGNLIADETLWRSGLDPNRPGGSLSTDEVDALHATLRRTLQLLMRRGGSHTGDLQRARVRGGRCPRDGALLLRRTIGGRTTYSCPVHQR